MGIIAGFMVPHPPMIVPQIGRGSEAQVADTVKAYERIADEIAELRPDTIVITSPHSVMYADYFHISPGSGAKGNFASFRAPGVRFDERYDEELVKEICRLADEEDFPAGTAGERDPSLDHGTMVPLWFIRNKYKDGKIVRIGLSGLPLIDHYRLGQLIQKAADNTGRRAVFVGSGDLSHKLRDYGPYGFAKEGPEYDERIMDVMGRAAFGELFDFDESFCDRAAECGHRSFVIMAGAFDGIAVKAEKLVHQDVTGVGYGICTFYPDGPDESRQFLRTRLGSLEKEIEEKHANSDEYVRLAYASVEAYVSARKTIPVPDGLPDELTGRRAGAFVEIIANAISACARDPRFSPVRPDELPWLEISVDVLGEPEDIDSKDMLDVKRYGVIVTSGRKRGLLLPDLDGVDTVDQQIDIARQKAGIHKFEKYSLQRFEVIRHY